MTWVSDTTALSVSWPAASSVTSWHRWTPYSRLSDAYDGVDFVPIAISEHSHHGLTPALALSDRPLATYNISTITGVAFPGEGYP